MQTILVVDDMATERKHLRRLLEPKGYKVVEADSGDSAVSAALEHSPDLILMDVVMPTSGFHGTRQLKKNPATKNIPVVMVTSVNKETDRENAQDNGAVGYIVKPATESSMLAVLNEIFYKKPTV